MGEKMTLTIEETAKVLGLCRPTVLELTHRADFPAFRVGRRVLISRTGLAAWVENQAGCGHSDAPARSVL